MIFATGGFGGPVASAIHSVLTEPVDSTRVAADVVAMRKKLDLARSRHDLKRGSGGLTDLEFIVQYLVLVHACRHAELLVPNFWDALAALKRHGILDSEVHNELCGAYDFLRTVEGRLRLIHNRAVSELPENPAELKRLARRLDDGSAISERAVELFLADARRITRRIREHFDRIVVPLTPGCELAALATDVGHDIDDEAPVRSAGNPDGQGA